MWSIFTWKCPRTNSAIVNIYIYIYTHTHTHIYMHMCICSNELFYQAACDGLSTHRVALKTLKKGQILGHVFGKEGCDQI